MTTHKSGRTHNSDKTWFLRIPPYWNFRSPRSVTFPVITSQHQVNFTSEIMIKNVFCLCVDYFYLLLFILVIRMGHSVCVSSRGRVGAARSEVTDTRGSQFWYRAHHSSPTWGLIKLLSILMANSRKKWGKIFNYNLMTELSCQDYSVIILGFSVIKFVIMIRVILEIKWVINISIFGI